MRMLLSGAAIAALLSTAASAANFPLTFVPGYSADLQDTYVFNIPEDEQLSFGGLLDLPALGISGARMNFSFNSGGAYWEELDSGFSGWASDYRFADGLYQFIFDLPALGLLHPTTGDPLTQFGAIIADSLLPALPFSAEYNFAGNITLGVLDNATPAPIPLPATGILLLAGLAGLSALRRRRAA